MSLELTSGKNLSFFSFIDNNVLDKNSILSTTNLPECHLQDLIVHKSLSLSLEELFIAESVLKALENEVLKNQSVGKGRVFAKRGLDSRSLWEKDSIGVSDTEDIPPVFPVIYGITAPSGSVTNIGGWSFSDNISSNSVIIAYNMWRAINDLQRNGHDSRISDLLEPFAVELSSICHQGLTATLSENMQKRVNGLPFDVDNALLSIWTEAEKDRFWSSLKNSYQTAFTVVESNIATRQYRLDLYERNTNILKDLIKGQQFIEDGIAIFAHQLLQIVSPDKPPDATTDLVYKYNYGDADSLTYKFISTGSTILQALNDLSTNVYPLLDGSEGVEVQRYADYLKQYINKLLHLPMTGDTTADYSARLTQASVGYLIGYQQIINHLRTVVAIPNHRYAFQIQDLIRDTPNDTFFSSSTTAVIADVIAEIEDGNDILYNLYVFGKPFLQGAPQSRNIELGANNYFEFDPETEVEATTIIGEELFSRRYSLTHGCATAVYGACATVDREFVLSFLSEQATYKKLCDAYAITAENTFRNGQEPLFKEIEGLRAAKNIYKHMIDFAGGREQEDATLQDRYRSFIVNTVTPQQRYYFNELIQDMNFTNNGSELCNTLLNLLPKINTNATRYNVSEFLRLANSKDITAAYDVVFAAYEGEKAAISQDLDTINNALNIIPGIRSNIANNPNITRLQKNELLVLLDNTYNSLKASKAHGEELKVFLNTLLINEIFDEPMNPYAFSVGGPVEWPYALPFLEQQFVTGNTKRISQGGISSLHSLLQSAFSNYADGGQAQQLTIDLQINAIQQEWTLIASGLHTLNRLLSTIINKIKAKRSH